MHAVFLFIKLEVVTYHGVSSLELFTPSTLFTLITEVGSAKHAEQAEGSRRPDLYRSVQH
jgi:hypothetical protein